MGGLQVSLGIILVFSGQHAEGRCDGFVLVGHDGIGNSSDTALLAGSLQPSPVALLGIGRGGDDLHSAHFEFGEFFLKGEELRGADEGEVHRIKEEQNVFFSQELIQGVSVYDFVAVYYGTTVIDKLVDVLPAWVMTGFSVAGGMMPAIGFAILINVIGKRSILPFFFIGFFIVKIFGCSALQLTCLGIPMAIAIVLMTKDSEDATVKRALAATASDDDDDE